MHVMVNQETLSYINNHRTDDSRRLALQSHPSDVDMPYALEQIAGWQAACRKLPRWASTDGIVYPPHLSMEQCSSQPTAIYKRQVAQRLLGDRADTLVDLTGGYGVDFSYMAEVFRHGTYVERQEELCEAARHNFPLLGIGDAEIICGDGTEYLSRIEHASMIYLDPARRDNNGGRTYGIADCTPDVTVLKDVLVEKADFVMVKLSPMLDWHKAVEDVGEVGEVHIVSVKNECKELLLVIDCNGISEQTLQVFCTNYTSDNTATIDKFPAEGNLNVISPTFSDPMRQLYVYEPNASLMKFGEFSQLCSKYGVSQIAPSSNLFVSKNNIEEFPGRRFRIEAVSGMNKKELRKVLGSIDKANITTRNFPLSVAELRKRLKLKDGGNKYIFATTLQDGSHKLICCIKA